MKTRRSLSYTLAAIGAIGLHAMEALASFADYTLKYTNAINSKPVNPRACQICGTTGSTKCATEAGFTDCLAACKASPAAATVLKGCIEAFEKNNHSLVISKTAISETRERPASPTQAITNDIPSAPPAPNPNSDAENERLRKRIAELERQLAMASTQEQSKNIAGAARTLEIVEKEFFELYNKLANNEIYASKEVETIYNKLVEEYAKLKNITLVDQEAVDKELAMELKAEENKIASDRRAAITEMDNKAYTEVMDKKTGVVFSYLENKAAKLWKDLQDSKISLQLPQQVNTWTDAEKRAVRKVLKEHFGQGVPVGRPGDLLQAVDAAINDQPIFDKYANELKAVKKKYADLAKEKRGEKIAPAPTPSKRIAPKKDASGPKQPVNKYPKLSIPDQTAVGVHMRGDGYKNPEISQVLTLMNDRSLNEEKARKELGFEGPKK